MKPYHCSDGMCGADDCGRCHPEYRELDDDGEPYEPCADCDEDSRVRYIGARYEEDEEW